MANEVILDRKWVRSSFFAKIHGNKTDYFNRSHATSGLYKFEDTSLGGNVANNVPYSRTRFADIKERRIVNVGFGMGRKYSEMIDDNKVVGHFRPGVQSFNGLLNFFSNSYTYRAGKYINTGRSPGFAYTAGRLIGVVSGYLVPSALAIGLIGKIVTGIGTTRFYTIKPTVYAYWQAVNNIVNTLAAGMSISVPPSQKDRQRDLIDQASAYQMGETVDQVRRMLPSVWTQSSSSDNFGIDIYSISTRYQRLADRFNKKLADHLSKKESLTSMADALATQAKTIAGIAAQVTNRDGGGYGAIPGGINEYINTYLKHDPWAKDESDEDQKGDSLNNDDNAKDQEMPAATPDNYQAINERYKSRQKDYSLTPSSYDESLGIDAMKAHANDGSEWFSLMINGTESVSESFSNSSRESTLGSTYNGLADASRVFHFDFAGGKLVNGALSSLVGGAVDTVKNLIGGMTDSLGISGMIFGAISGSKIDIPQDYAASSVSLPSARLKLELRTPYANPMSVFQDLMIPLAQCLALALPRSTGTNTYGSPFLFEYFCRGRNTIRIGMVESLNISRGVANVKWTREGRPLGIDIDINIKDMSSIMHMPISLTDNIVSYFSILDQANKIIYGQDGAFQDYLDTLAGLSLPQLVYKMANWKRNWMKAMKDYDTKFDMDNYYMWMMNETPLDLLKIVSVGTARR